MLKTFFEIIHQVLKPSLTVTFVHSIRVYLIIASVSWDIVNLCFLILNNLIPYQLVTNYYNHITFLWDAVM